MTPLLSSIIAFSAFFILMLLGMPIAFSFATVGFIGLWLVRGLNTGLSILGSGPYIWASLEPFVTLALFVLMGLIAFACGISGELYATAHKWVGRFRGGLAQATVLACTGFAACTGSSVAGAATMGTIAYPEMESTGYNRRLSTGAIAAGGTLGVLIPPSGAFIVYGYLTQTSIASLFMAGILPGLLLSFLFLTVIFLVCRRNPRLGPRGPSYSWKEMIISLRGVIGMLVLMLLVIGGLYFGIFTPSEAGAIGAFGALIIALVRRRLTVSGLISALRGTAEITCFAVTIAIGAMIFNTFLATNGFNALFEQWISSIPLSPYVILICILLIYVPLGMFMDLLSMTLLTIPIVTPVLSNLGFDLIWFGVLMVLMSEMALITPPIGMNCFVVQGVTKVPLQEVFRGTLPFVIMMFVCLIFLVAFPQISLFLPNTMG
jgi:tripartite ATP-independent transporter DctM subunit